jgi:cytoskeletal protein RodZ
LARLGETLRAQREKKGITLEQAASDTHIREKFLKALEDSDYQTLPGTVYTKGFLRNYAEYLELPTEELVVQFHQERDLPDAPRSFKPLNPIARRSLIFTPAVLVPVVVLAGIVLFVSYLYYQFVSFAVPPKIEVTEPASDAIAQSADFVVKGKTVPDGTVTVQVFPGPLTLLDIHPNADGTFSVHVQLNPGSNHIVVEVLDVTGKVGQASRVVRLETAAASPGQPVIIVEAPANGATVTNTPVLVSGRFDASVTALTVNGVQMPISNARLFEIRVTYPAGPQTISIVARNASGATTTETRAVTVAYTAAVVSVTLKGGEAWLQATVEGTVVPGTGRLFKEGESATYTGREVRLRSGNGAATIVSYNGQPAVAMGQQGEVVERIYTAQ